MRIAFTTLGCKINQYETELIRQDLAAKGNTIVPFDADADVYVINTCSVTGKSDYQCRQVIRQTVKRGLGSAKVLVTGCYASTRPEEIIAIPGVNAVISNAEKTTIADRIMREVAQAQEESVPGVAVKAAEGRTRSYLKIQDGCDNRCSYCIVPLARGGSRSAGFDEIIREFDRLAQAGCPEIVLTGIHIGTYGADLVPERSLSTLVGSLVERRGQSRIRLSSIEANEINGELIGYLGQGLCRHLHIPLQSGDDSILSAMKRKYTSDFYRELLHKLNLQVPGIALGADVIVGFPGEGEKEFQNTLDLVQQSPLTHLHVFSYSPRPGTPAADMKNQVTDKVKKERNEQIRDVGSKKNYDFRKKLEGKELEIVIEDKQNASSGFFTGLSDNYVRVSVINAKEAHIGQKMTVLMQEVTDKENFAVIL